MEEEVCRHLAKDRLTLAKSGIDWLTKPTSPSSASSPKIMLMGQAPSQAIC